ncbi:hypothetical protein [Brevundimonas sp.]|uniref:hypothetical protein n=1 Tax=Brevundimonas sp. TaxID=1871086 RepID=UPI002D4F3561|nr:hypothetical protein [Brevundimonas sp.]HYC74424.1 hypothetical protein [Brevundimonas sp.]
MLPHGHPGPPAPPRLITLQVARRRGLVLRLHCEPCGRCQAVDSASLPERRRTVCLGELWLAGRFRCAGCRRPAGRLEVVEAVQGVNRTCEVWRPGDPLVAERLRRHWRWDRYDRRDWGAWFGRG